MQSTKIGAVLRSHPSVQDARVHGMGDQPIAYVLPVPSRAARVAGQVRYELPNGMAVVSENRREAMSQYKEFFIKDAFHSVSVCDGDVVFDVGANIGLFTLMVQGWDTRVLAFEPAPQTYRSLEANVALYGHNVQSFQLGVGSRDEMGEFTFYHWSPAGSGYYSEDAHAQLVAAAKNRAVGMFNMLPHDSDDERKMLDRYLHQLSGDTPYDIVATPLRSISSIIAEQGVAKVDLLKIDVEGHELYVLQGIAEEHWPEIGQIMLEAHRQELAYECSAILRHQGYELVVEQTPARGPGTCQMYAVRPGRSRCSSERGLAQVTAIEANHPLSIGELQAFVEQAGFTSPVSFVIVDRLPTSELPDVVLRRSENGPVAVTGTEYKLTMTLREMLGGAELDLDDDFLEHGGNMASTMLLLKLATCVYKEFGIQLPIGFLFRGPYTIREIGAIIDGEKATQVSSRDL